MKTFLCLLVCAATAGAEIGYFTKRHTSESSDQENPPVAAASPAKDSPGLIWTNGQSNYPTPYPEITPDPSIIPPP